MQSSNHLRALLEYYWLRPETAVWRSLDCQMLANAKFAGPRLDIGCGDGAFSFLRANGRFAFEHDAFQQVANLDKFFSGVDIYDASLAGQSSTTVERKPDYQFTAGVDHKQSLLDKAAPTGLYGSLVQADANGPIPLESSQFKTIFSNILYWLESYQQTLKEIARLLASDGQAHIFVPSDSFRSFSFYQQLYVPNKDPKWKWLELLDRGRSGNVKFCQSLEKWTADFEAAGLRVETQRRYLGRLTLQAWDIGLRPLSPLLIEMVSKLKPSDAIEIKQKWVDTLMPLVEPIVQMDAAQGQDGGFFYFVLMRR